MIELKQEDFEATIQSGVTVIDFFGSWCNPCKLLMPTLEDLESKHPDIVFMKMDVENCKDQVDKLQIRAIPTIIIFKDGVAVDRIIGLHEEEVYQEALRKVKS